MYSANEAENSSRGRLVGDVVAINQLGRKVIHSQAALGTAQRKYEKFVEDHGHVGEIDFRDRTKCVMTILGLIAIYILDLYLFGPAAEFLGATLAGAVGLLVVVSKYLLPLIFLAIEIRLGLQIEEARRNAEQGHGSKAARWFWLGVGVALAVFMPCMAVAGASASAVLGGGSSKALIIGLGILSVVAHLLVLFGGKLLEEAKVFCTYAVMKSIYARRVARAKKALSRLLAQFNARFIRYVHAWRLHNNLYPQQPSGPFDDGVMGLLQQQFSTVTITSPRTSFPVAVADAPEDLS
jgi:hypothetical protein